MLKKIVFISLFSLVLVFLYSPVRSLAASFNNSYLRLNDLSSSSALSGTVCAQPSSSGAGTENKITIIFPSDFTISQTASNWTTTTTNLPQGSTIWPSIGASATSVSGRSVTFLSGDLTSSTLYCFNFSGASSTTGSAGNNKTGVLVTKNVSDTTIDSDDYALSIVSSNQINITASVDPQVSELPIDIVSTTVGTQFPQNTTINYEITYGTNTVGTIPLTIQASWSQGTIQGSPTPSVDVLNYVIGSASNAYSSTVPVIDTVNRTITWTISSIPGGTTNQTVNFSLITTSSYTGPNVVDFTVSANATSGSTVTPDDEVDQSYKFSGSINPGGPGDGRSDGLSDGKSDGKSSGIISAPTSLVINSIDIQSISQSEAKILISTNKKAALTIQYGTALNASTKSVRTTNFLTQNLVLLPNLTPETDYFFKVVARDENGNTKTSDIFTFRTASVSIPPIIDLNTLIVTSNNNILISPSINQDLKQKNIILIPRDTIFEFQFKIDKNIPVKLIQAIVRNKKVLGINTFSQEQASTSLVDLVETQPGVYTGKLKSDSEPGVYEIYVRIIDYNGNITEQKLADLKVVLKFKVLKKGTDTPVENVRVLLYLYNLRIKTYDVISPNNLSIENPIYSLPNGRYDIVLPYGKYKADISSIGFKPQTVEFEISPQEGEYPIIYLEEEPFNLINTFIYYRDSFVDSLNDAINYTRLRAQSNRLFDLITTGTLLIFILTTLFAFSAKTHISFLYLPYFLIYRLNILLKKEKSSIFLGKVVASSTKNPISKAIVTLSDSKNNILTTLKTNKLGEFYYPHVNLGTYKISIIKSGFKDITSLSFKKEDKMIPLTISIVRKESKLEKEIGSLLIYLTDFVGLLFEFMLFVGIIVEIFFIFTFGFLRIAPFLALSIINIILLVIFIYKPRQIEVNKISL